MREKILLPYMFFLATRLLSTETSLHVGAYLQETRTFYSASDGLSADAVNCITLVHDSLVYAGTENGVYHLEGRWHLLENTTAQPVRLLASDGRRIAALLERDNTVAIIQNDKTVMTIPITALPKTRVNAIALSERLYLAHGGRIFSYSLAQKAKPQLLPILDGDIRQIAVGQNQTIYLAASTGLFQYDPVRKNWQPLYPQQGKRSWRPVDVRGVALDRSGSLWFACPQGVGCRTIDGWSLFTAEDGLPFDDFTAVATGERGLVWFGTSKGAIRFDGKIWEYRQGLRWLPDDQVKAIVVSRQGRAWFATCKGVSSINQVPMTLAQKAAWFEQEIDRYHRRTPYEYVLEVSLKRPGDKSEWTRQDSDNDGLWTAMYGSGECCAYAVTRDPQARWRAHLAFTALQFLSQVTQGGEPPAPAGFIARTILPTSGPDPNLGKLAEDQQRQQQEDMMWKILQPRWPKSKNGKWFWKTDASSDELDGHYFFYGLYYDLAAESESEKAQVRDLVAGLTDHIMLHGYALVDHDGKPTRWAHYHPTELNTDPRWFVERGLNSLSMLSYLYTAAHITGDAKYFVAADSLIRKHGYLQNQMNVKAQRGVGAGNQSDDEMAFMCYYNLIKYAPQEQVKGQGAVSMLLSWRMEYPEMNPFFNFLTAAMCAGRSYRDHWGDHPLAMSGSWLQDAVETLQRLPLDRINWQHDNRQRTDLVRLPEIWASYDDDPALLPHKAYRVNGKVIPVDERHFNHWNHDPFDLVTGGDGRELADGAVFLLPYYLGLYHGFIKE